MSKELKTIDLKGKQYVQVNTRVDYFNETYPKGSIVTSHEKQEGNAYIFQATVIPDIDAPTRFFNGTSYGFVDNEKAMEKLETVAVGRALAFMGIGIVDSIASADEVERFANQPTTVPTATSKTTSTLPPTAPFPAEMDMHDEHVELCDDCGAIMEFRKGVKNGKKWQGWFCTAVKTGHNVKWVK